MIKKKTNNKENGLYILPVTYGELEVFINKYKTDMLEQVVSSIQFAVEHKIPIIEVFQFKNSKFVITITEKEFKNNLDNIFNIYMKDENYELCSRVVKLQKCLKNA